MDKKILILVILGLAGSLVFFRYLGRIKSGRFLEAREESCNELEEELNSVYSNSSRNFSTKVDIISCDCYYEPDIPNKGVEKESTNYCTCDCVTDEGNFSVNVRKPIG